MVTPAGRMSGTGGKLPVVLGIALSCFAFLGYWSVPIHHQGGTTTTVSSVSAAGVGTGGDGRGTSPSVTTTADSKGMTNNFQATPLTASMMSKDQGQQQDGGASTKSVKKIENEDGLLEDLVKLTVSRCNEGGKNNDGHKAVSCIFCRDAIVTTDGIYCRGAQSPEAQQAMAGKKAFPPNTKGRGTRHHLKPMSIFFTDPPQGVLAKVTQGATPIGYYQSPVAGAMYLNVWHTVADLAVMMFHTVSPLLSLLDGSGGTRRSGRGGEGAVEELKNSKQLVTWVSRTAYHHMGRGCFDVKTCTTLPLFQLLEKMIGEGYAQVLMPSISAVKFEYVIVGLNTDCSPIPTEDVGTPSCQRNIFQLRQRILSAYDLPLTRTVSEEENKCPIVHVMSRQKDRYRRITPFDEVLSALQEWYRKHSCPTNNLRVYALTTSVPMREQIQTIVNSTILLAGRGGGTTFSMFLPLGGGYLSLSGFDRWNPFRDLIPKWITLEHHEAKLVHHENPNKPPQRFGSGRNSYIDPNRAGYVVSPPKLAASLDMLVNRMQQRLKEEGPIDPRTLL